MKRMWWWGKLCELQQCLTWSSESVIMHWAVILGRVVILFFETISQRKITRWTQSVIKQQTCMMHEKWKEEEESWRWRVVRGPFRSAAPHVTSQAWICTSACLSSSHSWIQKAQLLMWQHNWLGMGNHSDGVAPKTAARGITAINDNQRVLGSF